MQQCLLVVVVIGTCRFALSSFASAKESFNRALALFRQEQQQLQVQQQEKQSQEQQGEEQLPQAEAAEGLTKADRLKASEFKMLYNLGLCESRMSNWQEALDWYDMASQLANDCPFHEEIQAMAASPLCGVAHCKQAQDNLTVSIMDRRYHKRLTRSSSMYRADSSADGSA